MSSESSSKLIQLQIKSSLRKPKTKSFSKNLKWLFDVTSTQVHTLWYSFHLSWCAFKNPKVSKKTWKAIFISHFNSDAQIVVISLSHLLCFHQSTSIKTKTRRVLAPDHRQSPVLRELINQMSCHIDYSFSLWSKTSCCSSQSKVPTFWPLSCIVWLRWTACFSVSVNPETLKNIKLTLLYAKKPTRTWVISPRVRVVLHVVPNLWKF